MTPPLARRGAWWAIAGVTAAALALRSIGISGQLLIDDDRAVGETALNFLATGWPGPTMWNHPRLRDLLVSASLAALGHGPWGLKLWSVLLGTASVAATGALVLAVSGDAAAAVIAAALLAIDPLHLDFSRQAINDVYSGFFSVAAVLALLRYRSTRAPTWIAAAGLLLGLGIASKWSVAFPVGAAALAVLARELRDAPRRSDAAAEVALFASGLVLLPLAVYLLTFLPWFGRGHGFLEWVRLQHAMAVETATHTGYDGTKLPGYPGEVVSAVRWFTTPVWYVDFVPPPDAPGHPAGVLLSGVANPIACLAALPAAALAGWRAWRARDGAAAWLALLFLGAWLPFVLVPRPVWTNSAVGVFPFAFALVGWAAARAHRRRPVAARALLAGALAISAVLWPAAIGRSNPVTDRVLHALVPARAFDRRMP